MTRTAPPDVSGPAAPATPPSDPVAELEALVDRLSRIVLNAHALLERRQRASAPVLPAAGHEERLRRLHTGLELARVALVTASASIPAGAEAPAARSAPAPR